MSLSTLRNEIKKLGFTIKTQTCSFGTVATYVHIESNQKYNFNCAPKSVWQKWDALREFCTSHKDLLTQIQTETKITGLFRPCKAV